MNTNIFRLLACTFLAWTFIFQSVAFAMDPIATSQNFEKNKMKLERITKKMTARYVKMSDKKKLRLLKRTQRKLTRGVNKIEKMSNEKFQKRIAKRLKKSNKKASSMKLSAEETTIVGDIKEFSQVKAPALIDIDKIQFTQKSREALIEIEREIENLTYKLSSTLKSKTVKSQRAPAALNGKTWNKIIYGVLIGLIIASFFTTVALYILAGIIVLVAGFFFLLVMLLKNMEQDFWPWS